ncbi:exported hypothetical protein [Xanthomonas citri pv. citri]|nr:exported hypothetical protein [Xanthomonas citri pv. citri]CEE24991.1 exported hypothetical protein [Xanthomonas citri pv. citri]CEE31249.1 exported hypothetical protein [Xanthomonas citri pv. citri]CEE52069.1 exported hypothetical protein [Xanthomonas citri pv. citri]CEE58777.1 exported hypothetical protein [Xanthomonas citri pv. citri]
MSCSSVSGSGVPCARTAALALAMAGAVRGFRCMSNSDGIHTGASTLDCIALLHREPAIRFRDVLLTWRSGDSHRDCGRSTPPSARRPLAQLRMHTSGRPLSSGKQA